jgi:hypothetical protein
MCFSAGASFAGGVIITGTGVATFREVHKPSQLVFASIPVFFGVQQILEGCQRTHLLGILMFLSCLITALFFTQYLISVWCFFAALISGVIFWILRDSKKEFNYKKLALLETGSVIFSHK